MNKVHVHKFEAPPSLIYDSKARSYRLMPGGREVPSVAGILAAAGLGATEEHQLDTDVRAACAQVDLGRMAIDDVRPHVRPYVEAWLRFCEKYKARWEHIETHVLNASLGYACTPGRLGRLCGAIGGPAGASAIVEIATDIAPYSAGLRLSACRLACSNSFPTDVGILVQLDRLGRYGFAIYSDAAGDRELFLGALEKYRRRQGGWRQKLRRWFGRPMPKQAEVAP